jgi:hypothetical protein
MMPAQRRHAQLARSSLIFVATHHGGDQPDSHVVERPIHHRADPADEQHVHRIRSPRRADEYTQAQREPDRSGKASPPLSKVKHA